MAPLIAGCAIDNPVKFSTKNLISIITIGLLILTQVFSLAGISYADLQCVPYVLEDKLLDDVLSSPQMAPLSGWKITKGLSGWQSGCTWGEEGGFGLTYALPNDFSKFGLQYFFNVRVRTSIDTGKVVNSSLDTINEAALKAKSAIQSTENNAPVKEFIDKVGVEKAVLDHGFIEYWGDSFKSFIKYSTEINKLPPGLYDYDLPGNITWQSIPEIVRLRSIFQNETPAKNCFVDLQDKRINPSHGTTLGYGKPGWDFYVDVLPGVGVECPSLIVATIFDDGAQTIRSLVPLDPIISILKPSGEVVQIKTSEAISSLLVEQKLVAYVGDIKWSDNQKQYDVTGYRTVRLFGFIPIKLKLQLVVNAITGAVEHTSRPWWAFLVRY